MADGGGGHVAGVGRRDTVRGEYEVEVAESGDGAEFGGGRDRRRGRRGEEDRVFQAEEREEAVCGRLHDEELEGVGAHVYGGV